MSTAGEAALIDTAALASLVSARARPGEPLIVGVTGSVAAGKTRLCASLADQLRPHQRIEVISTDGFLRSNEALATEGLSMRKGYPESYDCALLCGTLQRARWGPVRIPGYSHATYDLAPDLDRTIDRPDVLIVEGLGLSPREDRQPAGLLDLLVYLDASEEDLEAWFVERFMNLWRAAESDPSSFYVRFRAMSEADAEAFARAIVWGDINLPNLREHIVRAREAADIVLMKETDHRLRLVRSSKSDQT